MIHNGIPSQTLWSRCPAPSLHALCIFVETTGCQNDQNTGSQADSLATAAPRFLNSMTRDKYNPLNLGFPSCIICINNTVYFTGLLRDIPDQLHAKPLAQGSTNDKDSIISYGLPVTSRERDGACEELGRQALL